MRSQSSSDDVLTLAEAAKLLRVSERSLWLKAKAGVVPHRRVGALYRFSKRQLLAWLEGREEKQV